MPSFWPLPDSSEWLSIYISIQFKLCAAFVYFHPINDLPIISLVNEWAKFCCIYKYIHTKFPYNIYLIVFALNQITYSITHVTHSSIFHYFPQVLDQGLYILGCADGNSLAVQCALLRWRADIYCLRDDGFHLKPRGYHFLPLCGVVKTGLTILIRCWIVHASLLPVVTRSLCQMVAQQSGKLWIPQ